MMPAADLARLPVEEVGQEEQEDQEDAVVVEAGAQRMKRDFCAEFR